LYIYNVEIEFTKIFLIFYRKFLRPSELLDLLMDRYPFIIIIIVTIIITIIIYFNNLNKIIFIFNIK